jgi:hypothetical protein
MKGTILLFCCWLLLSTDVVDAASSAVQGTDAPSRAVKPLIIPARKTPVKSSQPPAGKASHAAHSAKAAQPTKSAKSVHAAKAAVIKKPLRSSAASSKLTPLKVNLSLPPGLIKNMEFGKPLAEVEEVPVLPPMFGEAAPEPSAFQLSGKLITNERQKEQSDNYFDSVDGAQLSIEFRQ